MATVNTENIIAIPCQLSWGGIPDKARMAEMLASTLDHLRNELRTAQASEIAIKIRPNAENALSVYIFGEFHNDTIEPEPPVLPIKFDGFDGNPISNWLLESVARSVAGEGDSVTEVMLRYAIEKHMRAGIHIALDQAALIAEHEGEPLIAEMIRSMKYWTSGPT